MWLDFRTETDQELDEESVKLSTPHTLQPFSVDGATLSPSLTLAGDKHSLPSSPLAVSDGMGKLLFGHKSHMHGWSFLTYNQ